MTNNLKQAVILTWFFVAHPLIVLLHSNRRLFCTINGSNPWASPSKYKQFKAFARYLKISGTAHHIWLIFCHTDRLTLSHNFQYHLMVFSMLEVSNPFTNPLNASKHYVRRERQQLKILKLILMARPQESQSPSGPAGKRPPTEKSPLE
jgi:hypothetical protein